MASQIAEFIVRARDEASNILRNVSSEFSKLAGTGGKMRGLGVDLTIFNQAIQGLQQGMRLAQGAVDLFGGALSDKVEDLSRLSESTGTTIQQLQILQRTFENAGLGAESATTSLVFMNRAIGRGEPLLARMGITADNAYAALLQLGEAFAKSTDTAAKQAIALKLTGRSSSELIGILGRLRAETDATATEMAAYNDILSEAGIEKAARVDKQLDTLRTAWSGLKTTLAELTAGPLADFLAGLNAVLLKLAQQTPKQKGTLGGTLSGVDKGEVDSFGSMLRDIGEKAQPLIRPFTDANEQERARDAEREEVRKQDEEERRFLRERQQAREAFAREMARDASGQPGGPSPQERRAEVARLQAMESQFIEEDKRILAERRKLLREAQEVEAERRKLLGGGFDTPDENITGGLNPRVVVEANRGPRVVRTGDGEDDSAREKRIKKLIDTLGVGRRKAEEFADALDRVEKSDAREKLAKDLIDAGVKPGDIPGTDPLLAMLANAGKLMAGGVPKREKLELPGPAEFDFEKYNKQLSEWLATMRDIDGAIVMVEESWREALDEMTSTAAVFDSLLGATFAGMESGFSQVAVNLIGTGQTLQSALATIAKSIADTFLAELGRIAAHKLFAWLFGAFFGPAGAVVGAAVGGVGGGNFRSPPPAEKSSTLNITLNALDQRSIARDLASPRGALRNALRAAAIGRDGL